MENDISALTSFVTQGGFAIVVAAFLLLRMEKEIKAMTAEIQRLAVCIERYLEGHHV